MTCRETDARLADYLDDLLPPLARQRFARHLGACRCCRWNVLTYADTVDLTRAAFDEPPALGDADARALVAALATAIAIPA